MAREQGRKRLRIILAAVVVLIVAATAAWQWTPLSDYAEPRMIARALRGLIDSPWLPLWIGIIYVASNAVMFPITVLCLATILALGTHPGFMYATLGSLLAALVTYAAGWRYGPDKIRKLDMPGLARLSDGLRRGGILQVTILRLLPLAPFSVVNLMAGAAKVRVVPFSIGTILGMLPGNLLFTVFGRQLRQLISNPSPWEIATFAAVIVVASLLFWWLHKLTMSRTAPRQNKARA
ncbi:MAG TPA: VTT domain-containing protein [Verrucomicrobiae bacterium]|nr:VTT domain-containing protein [Verrucomicrobiae bacterium]